MLACAGHRLRTALLTKAVASVVVSQAGGDVQQQLVGHALGAEHLHDQAWVFLPDETGRELARSTREQQPLVAADRDHPHGWVGTELAGDIQPLQVGMDADND